MALWAKSAGRCVLCSDYVVDERVHFRRVLNGEMAHVVGATSGEGSPRGKSSTTKPDRALESNLLLLCHPCHRHIDDVELQDLYTVDFLLAQKLRHESRVREATRFATLKPSLVIRSTSSIRGSISRASDRQVSYAQLNRSLTGVGDAFNPSIVEIDLRDSEDSGYIWDRAVELIDRSLAPVNEAFASGKVEHASIFFLAPIPILIYMGSALGDKLNIEIFSKFRRDDDLAWTVAANWAEAPKFATEIDRKGDQDSVEIMVTVSVSGEVQSSRLPSSISGMPRFSIFPAKKNYGPLLMDNSDSLDEFRKVWISSLSQIESMWPKLERIHLVMAVPAAAAIEAGRSRMKSAQAEVLTYQLDSNQQYVPAIRIAR